MTTPSTLIKPSNVLQKQKAWNLIILNDPVNLMQYVVRIIMKIFGHDEATAVRMMLDVHNNGKAIVWSGKKETAELYLLKLLQAQLSAKIEEVNDD